MSLLLCLTPSPRHVLVAATSWPGHIISQQPLFFKFRARADCSLVSSSMLVLVEPESWDKFWSAESLSHCGFIMERLEKQLLGFLSMSIPKMAPLLSYV